MNAREAAWQPLEEAPSALEPEAGLVGQLDMAGFGRSLVTVLARSAWLVTLEQRLRADPLPPLS
jgi:hypothetical protein